MSGGPSGLFFDLQFVSTVGRVSPGHTQTEFRARMYQYRLPDYDHRELLVYHWQPGRDFAGPDHPHLHVSAALTVRKDAMTRRRISLDKVHLVTGYVWPPAAGRMLITEFGVALQRPDWDDTLDRAETGLTRMVTV